MAGWILTLPGLPSRAPPRARRWRPGQKFLPDQTRAHVDTCDTLDPPALVEGFSAEQIPGWLAVATYAGDAAGAASPGRRSRGCHPATIMLTDENAGVDVRPIPGR